MVIKGGSVNGTVCLYNGGLPTNGSSAIYLTTATLDGANIKVTDTNLTGGLANYGMTDVYTDDSSKVYFWLPEGPASLTVGEDTYKDTIAASPTAPDTNELIRMKRISELDIELVYSETSYTGSQIQPTVTVKDGDTTLTQDTDYTLTYGENLNAGTGTVTITAKDSSNYSGSVDKTFTITQKSANIAAQAQTITYGGELDNTKIHPTLLVSGHTVKSVVLTASTTDVTDNGTITPSNAVIEDAQGNDVTANYKISYINGRLTIEKGTSGIAFKTDYNPDRTYDGTALANPTADELTITGAKYSDVTFTWYTDASCTTKTTITGSGAAKEGDAPVNAGIYYVQAVIPDSTNVSGSTANSEAITISPKSISISGATIEDVVYNADGYTLNVTEVTFNDVVEGETLTLKTDYTIIAKLTGTNAVGDNVAATVTVELKNDNYELGTTTFDATVNIKEHTHDWTYTTEGSTITATCAGQGTCTVTGNTAAITVNAPDTDVRTYDGTVKEATVTGSIDGVTTPVIVYTAAGGSTLTDNKPVNAGNYTASITIEDADGTEHKASVDFEIEKATPDIGEVSVNELKDTLDVSQVELDRTNETVDGTLALTDTTLQYGTHTYNWKFTPTGDDAVNYKEITGTVEITVNDTVAPTAGYKTGTNDWKQLGDTDLADVFSKDGETVEISFSDEVSQVATKQYFVSEEIIVDTDNVEWNDYTEAIKLNTAGSYYIYVKVTDNAGNVAVFNTEGIVIYKDSVINQTLFTYEYKQNKDLSVPVTMNGNTFAKLTDSEGNVIGTDLYDFDNESGKVVLKAAYLDTFAVDKYYYVLYMNPQGIETGQVTLAYDFSVKVTAADAQVTKVPEAASGLVYTGEAQALVSAGEATGGTIKYSLDGEEYFETIPTATAAGAYTVYYKVFGDANHNDTESRTVIVNVAKKSAFNVEAVTKSYSNSKVTADEINLASLLPTDCGEVTYGTLKVIGNVAVEAAPSVNQGVLSYTVMQGEVGAEGRIEITVTTQNYEDVVIVVNLSLYQGMTPVELFVERMYTVALNRDADEAGLANWAAQLEAGVYNGADIAAEFILGEEFALRKLNNEEFVDVLYLTFFDRKADSEGRAHWVAVLEAGFSREYVLSNFVNLGEFTALCESYGIERGVMLENGHVVNQGIVKFVERLYEKVLGRSTDAEGVYIWSATLAVGAQDAKTAVANFFGSEEYALKATDNETFVKDLYAVFMDREADADGLNFWVSCLEQYGMTRDDVLAEFANSAEFKEIAARYGLE